MLLEKVTTGVTHLCEPLEVTDASVSWQEFCEQLRRKAWKGLAGRCGLISMVQELSLWPTQVPHSVTS